MYPPSMLDVNNPAAYTPIKVDWEVQGKRGCCWVPLDTINCFSDRTAARRVRGVHRYKRLRVRASATLGVDPGKWRVFTFGDTE